jgi:AcrR family transcriptional regulator
MQGMKARTRDGVKSGAKRAPRAARKSAAPRDVRTTPERILDAAEARFAAKGYDATSLGDIADDVHIRTPSLYKHFGGKHALYAGVLRRLLDPYFELLETLLVVPRDAAQAEKNLSMVLAHYVKTPNLAKLVQHAALAGGEELTLVVEHWYAPLFERAVALTEVAPLLRKEKKRAQAISLVVAFHSFMSGYVTMAPLHARLTGEDPHGPHAIARHLEILTSVAGSLWKS